MGARGRWLLAGGVVVVVVGGVAATTLAGGSSDESRPRRARASASPSVFEGSTSEPLISFASRKELKTCFEPSVPLPEPTPGADRERQPDEQIRYVAQRVEKLRGLPYRSQVLPVYLTGRELRQRLRQEMYLNYPRRLADQQEVILRMLGAVRGGYLDLRLLSFGGSAANLLGLYMPGTKELLVRYLADSRALSAAEEVVLAHEAEHALADQTFGLPGNLRVRLANLDKVLAYRAVMEGDAEITAQQYARSSLSAERREDYRADAALAPRPVTRGVSPNVVSPYLMAMSSVEYALGMRFVCAVYLRGGWKAVDKLYDDPPDSTAEILYPDRFVAEEEPKDPRDPRVPPGWKAQPVHALGAADLLFLFESPGAYKNRGLPDAYLRAKAWAGGEVHVYRRGPRTALALDLVDRSVETYPLCESVNIWYRVSFPIDDEFDRLPHERFAIANRWGIAVLRCEGDEVRLGVAPSLGTARALAR